MRCWGYNGYGQCDVPKDLGPVVEVRAEGWLQGRTWALLADGSVRCWGYNEDGGCGVPFGVMPIEFVALADAAGGGAINAGLVAAVSPPPSPDLNGDGFVNGADLGLLLLSWGPCNRCDADLTSDGVVDGADIGVLLIAWGPA